MTTRVLAEPPSLAAAYAKAALGARLHRGDVLPDSVYTLPERPIDAAHLLTYQRLCGFRVGDVLPATYLHVLVFPLSMALMVQPGFPLALPGLVHVENEIRQLRPVRIEESVELRVHAADLRPRGAGRQVDLLAEARVGDELVWTGRSTYLRRGKASGSDGARPKREPAPRPAGPSSLIRVPGDIGRRYGAVSGDRNPIHLSALAAKVFGFPRAIAHGMWLKARVLAALEGRLPRSFSVSVAFKAPVLLPATVELFATHAASGWTLDLRDARRGQPHLLGSISRPI